MNVGARRGVVVWLTGRPASGKSTLAARVRDELPGSVLLDGDDVRAALQPPPGYDDESRDRFYATLAGLAALLARQGLVVLVPATAHRRAYRERARTAAPAFVEVHVDTSLEECAARDPKGLYAAARQGLPGVDIPYEAPDRPDVVAKGGGDEAAVRDILRRIQETAS